MGSTTKGRISITNEEKVKYVKREELDEYLNHGWRLGKPKNYITLETKEKLSKSLKGRPIKDEIRKKISSSTLGLKKSAQHAEKHRNKRWFTNGIVEIQIDKNSDVPLGYYPGRLPEKESTKRLKSIAHKGKKFSKTHLQRLREVNGSSEHINKVINTKRKNKSFKKSQIEDDYYDYLCDKYSSNDVVRQYKDDRYPFMCDFYIISIDTFIELNLHWTHGGMLFSEKDDVCKLQLSEWEEKAKTSKYYKNAIETWTIRDVEKHKVAKNNNLNYIIYYKKGDLWQN